MEAADLQRVLIADLAVERTRFVARFGLRAARATPLSAFLRALSIAST
jgi:hypothetical protein